MANQIFRRPALISEQVMNALIFGVVSPFGSRRSTPRPVRERYLAAFSLVAFDLVTALDGIAPFAIDEFSIHRIAGISIKRMKRDALGRGGCGVLRCLTGRQPSELGEAFPIALGEPMTPNS
ncbi:hypothetical protein LH464_14635 [Neorhizobium sp. T786]|nr:hypothetical protein [Neorhizobium xiangyangii]MCB5203713.1 hypothetical protein [Neorhizobium xiangyangii]